MKLDELKKMIAEEFESYMREEEDQVDVTVGDADVDLDDATGMEGEAGPEDALEQIYNMLKAYFEAEGEEEVEADLDGEEEVEDVADIDEAKEELEETEAPEVNHLQERFKKLANIIK